MKILSIETSADETAVSLVHVEGDFPNATYEILGNALHSQIALHAQYGGIFPSMAKREHAKSITPLLKITQEEAGMLEDKKHTLSQKDKEYLHELLYREEGMTDTLIAHLESYERPEIDLIAVTAGPGLEPTLWVGVNFAKALAKVWSVPVVSVNHMEGHVLASIFDVEEDDVLVDVQFPAIALLISGGHTELIHMKGWGKYEKIGQTRDDAVGEAFDKVARMLDIPYPGGPEIGKLAANGRQQNLPPFADLPRPMFYSGDLDFSFSGLKTAVRYAIENKKLTDIDKQAIARDFEDAAITVLLKKTADAVTQYNAQTIIIGGGVSASQYLRHTFYSEFLKTHPDLSVYFPNPGMSTDNSIMIALAGHANVHSALSPEGAKIIQADGNRSIANE